MKNTLGDLNLHLFIQLERLNEEDLKGEDLKEEILRANAVTNIAKEIISNAHIVLQSQKLQIEYSHAKKEMPRMLEG